MLVGRPADGRLVVMGNMSGHGGWSRMEGGIRLWQEVVGQTREEGLVESCLVIGVIGTV